MFVFLEPEPVFIEYTLSHSKHVIGWEGGTMVVNVSVAKDR